MDSVDARERSRIMASVKSRGNKSTELKLIQLFKSNGVKGWRRNYPIVGNPDFVFPKTRLAVFVDGCFWHGCARHCRIPKTNRKYWLDKIDRNKKRDRAVNSKLRKGDWIVVRIWEHELAKNVWHKKIAKIKEIVRQKEN